MATVQFGGVALRGLVCAVPGEPVNVRDLGTPFTADEIEKAAKTVGLDVMHRARPGQTAGDLSVAAARELLATLAWEPETIDGLIMVTQTPDHFLPATACVAHGQLGLADHCLAFDVGMGCSGYVYGLHLASQLVATGTCRRVVLLAGDTISRTLAPDDKSVALLFGDAGSATALEREEGAPAWSFLLGTDGRGHPHLAIREGAFREAAGGQPLQPPRLFMNGLEIFNFTLSRVPQLVRDVLTLHGWELATPDAFVLHQANEMILKKVQQKLGLEPERLPINIGRYGNTSMVSIPLILCDDLAPRLTGPGDARLVLAGFGVGYSWAGMAATLPPVRCARVVRA